MGSSVCETAEDSVARQLFPLPTPHATGKIEAPGQLESHYAPSKPLRLNAHAAHRHEFLIGFGAIPGNYNLSAEGNLAQAAAHLFDALHIADAAECSAIAVAAIPQSGILRSLVGSPPALGPARQRFAQPLREGRGDGEPNP